ncbi:bifunctional methyltransferase/pyrophosphohydrolase YabN [Fusibacter bizertensis]
MYCITIVGMGPGGEAYLTIDAFNKLTKAKNVFLRTDQHPVVDYLVKNGMQYASFDELYNQFETFEEVYEAIAEAIIGKAETSEVLYAVPGNPFVAEKSVAMIMAQAKGEVKIIHGASFIDAIVTSLHYDPVKGMTILDALTVESEVLKAQKDHLFIQVYDQMTASMLKLKLMEYWDEAHEVIVIQGAGIPDLEIIRKMPLYALDHQSELFNHLTSVFVPGGEAIKHELHELEEIMVRLRAENGCPWDREQTHESLGPSLIEEAYEVKEAIDDRDDNALVDELGDVLLQVVFHATIASEDGYFEMSDIINAICEKMIRRHPHVFSDVVVNSSEEVLVNWQAIKNIEKSNKTIVESMNSVSKSLPALLRAQKIQKRASDVGFDWKSAKEALSKIDEELLEVKEAIEKGNSESIKEEMGDLLLIIANVARLMDIDAEQCLVDATKKFVKRFNYIEEELLKNGMRPSSLLLERMEALWVQSKKWDKI